MCPWWNNGYKEGLNKGGTKKDWTMNSVKLCKAIIWVQGGIHDETKKHNRIAKTGGQKHNFLWHCHEREIYVALNTENKRNEEDGLHPDQNALGVHQELK